MAYIPVSPGTITGKAKYIYSLSDFSGGVNRTDDPCDLEDGQLSEAENLLSSGKGLRVRGGLCELYALEGEFHSMLEIEHSESRLFHCKSTLYSFDGKNLKRLCDTLPDEDSTFWRMNGKVYVMTKSGSLYEIDGDGNCKKISPYVPTLLLSESNSLDKYEVKEAINMLTSRIKVSYVCTSRTSITLTIPYPVDTEHEVVFYVDGEKKKFFNHLPRSDEWYYIGDYSCTKEGEILTIEYNAKGKAFDEYKKQICGCRIAAAYGGSTAVGTRSFLTGNDEYPEQYFCGELKEPTYFPDTMRETLGDGSECVTAVEKRYGKLYFFTPKRIYSMSYNFDEQNGASFPISEISTPVGCGMRGSVRLIDNTLVFADRHKGVFLLQSTDIFSELNVRPLSTNLSEAESFAADISDTAVYASCDCRGKYYLFDGKRLLAWSYADTPYYDSGNPGKSARRLCWQVLSGFEGCVALFDLKETLFAIRKRDGKLYLLKYSTDTSCDKYLLPQSEDEESAVAEESGVSESGVSENGVSENDEVSGERNTTNIYEEKPIVAHFKTKKYELKSGSVDINEKKRLYEFSFAYHLSAPSARLKLRFFADDKEFYEREMTLYKSADRVRVKLPPKKAYRYSVGGTASGGVELRGMSFLYSN